MPEGKMTKPLDSHPRWRVGQLTPALRPKTVMPVWVRLCNSFFDCFIAEVIPMTHHIGLLFNYRVRVWQGIPLVQRQGRGVHPTGNNASVMAVGAV
ncbi:hypothetical protein TIFTF001_052216 [Ficus carica]|uniref:Uncharacterized protein n=1 Tax=Ficus carica TaxID=3494 RepID=A0AA88EC36_FICCA|nr:hypothetical protein TIFTF001_052732 [Ficus carica]GMN73655.1 hypothetical protein TIFTF001_052216 [Ficus carica]